MKFTTAAATCLLLASAGTAQTLDPKVLAVAQATDILSKPLALSTYTWTYADRVPTLLPPVATHYCVLTGFTGKLAGDGEFANLYVDAGAKGGPRYMLGGTSKQPEFKITATCAAKAQFVQDAPKLPLAETIHPVVSASGCGTKQFSNGSSGAAAAQFLAAIGGRFAGDGETVAATTDTSGKGTTAIAARSGVVKAASLTIGRMFATPNYRTPTGTSTNAAASTFINFYKGKTVSTLGAIVGKESQFSYSADTYPSPANDALCGIVGIQGKFNGYGEQATVKVVSQAGRSMWQAIGAASYEATDPTVAVSVRCLARDQRHK